MATELEHQVARYCAWLEDQTGLCLHREGGRDTVDEFGVPVRLHDDRAAESSPRWRWWLLAAAVVIGVLAFGLFARATENSDSVETDTVADTPAPSSLHVTTTLGQPATADLRTTAPSTGAAAPTILNSAPTTGTIQPLALPEDAVDLVSVAQHGNGRIWVATYSADEGFGLAFSDDGGATWSHAALPDGVRATLQDPDLAIAADGDHVAVAVWGYNVNDTVGDIAYVSDDAGQTWTTATLSDQHNGAVNRATLDVLADGRLALTWYVDASAQHMLVSTGTVWSRLQKVDDPSTTRAVTNSSATTTPGPP